MQILESKQDDSVNFVIPFGEGYLEARYVRRQKDYFICYLSSQSGCNRGCQFCHLTSTGQTSFDQAGREDFFKQAEIVLEHYKSQESAKYVNFNWMARGEALCNPCVLNFYASHLGFDLSTLAMVHGLAPRFNISTIMPKTLNKSLPDCFPVYNHTIYYSLYSLDKEFRDKWLPGAMDPYTALDLLSEYQKFSKKIIKLHWAFIEDENDYFSEVQNIVEELEKRSLLVEFNCVRYNTPSEEQGKESEYYQQLTRFFDSLIDGKCKVIERVGFDVAASCGMFVGSTEND